MNGVLTLSYQSFLDDAQNYVNIEKNRMVRVGTFYSDKMHQLLSPDWSVKDRSEFFSAFKNLRKIQPLAFNPFYPILTILLGRFEKKQFVEFLKEAKDRNFQLTYALPLQFLREVFMNQWWNFVEEAQFRDILEALKEVFPEDLMLPIYLQEGLLAKPNLPACADHLGRALQSLAKQDAQGAVRELFKVIPTLTGFSSP